MPLPLIAAGIGAAAGLIQSAIQGRQNEKQRQWNEKMYNLQRQHQLQDWNMVNKYNSPEQQMARFEEAGLNKNLIYGQGSSGEAQSVKPADVKSWNPQTANFSGAVSGAVDTYIAATKAAQEIANMKAQERKTDAETLFITSHRAPYYESLMDINKKKLPLMDHEWGLLGKKIDLAGQEWQFKEKYNPRLMDYIGGRISEVKMHTDLMDANRQFSLDENKRQNEMLTWNIGLAAASILQKKAETARTYEDIKRISESTNYIKTQAFQTELENNLMQFGYTYNDKLTARRLGLAEVKLSKLGNQVMEDVFGKANWARMSEYEKMKRIIEFGKNKFINP